MTTATKAKKPPTRADAAVHLERLEKAAAKAREEAGEFGKRARDQQTQRHQLDVGLAQLAREDSSQFGDDGLPMPGTDASKMKTSLEKLDQSQLSGVVEGAQERAHETEVAVVRFIEANAAELSRKEYEGSGKAATLKMQRAVELLAEASGEYRASADRQRQIVIAVSGLDGGDVVLDPRVEEASRVDLEGLTPPRSRSLTPLVNEDPPRKIKAVSGGFVEASYLRSEDIAEDQPQRVEVA